MKVYNTLTGTKEEFVPIIENRVSMYVCGPTVYNYIHIGNARPMIVFDTIRRYFLYKGYDVTYIQNYTDIDDKIINAAVSENVTCSEISEKYILEVEKDAENLNVMKATYNPKVTEEMDGIIEMISTLIQKGFAYEKNGSVYFNTTKFPTYGKLSKKNIKDLQSGIRVAIDEEKENPVDFVLWKPCKVNEPFWESPWGKGRPGWHIECSVMAKKYIGNSIDIHAGGEDLIFPHHENEIAQSECANEVPFAHYWLHNRFVNIDNEKMSKSKGNFFTVREILERYSNEEIRFFILSAHYRSPLNFSEELMLASRSALNRIKNVINNLEFLIKNSKNASLNNEESILISGCKNYKKNFETAMEDDFNTADAISAIFDLVKYVNINTDEKSSVEYATLLLNEIDNLMDILGLKFADATNNTLENEIEQLIKNRQEARENKDWKKADIIRDDLLAIGVIIKDTPLGVKWSYKDK